MSFEAVKLGVVGAGSFGLLHATTITGLAEARLVALVDRRPERLGHVTSVRGWTDLDAALAESEAEAWVVASSTVSHVPVTKAILSAGKPVLLEKPVAASLAEAETLRPLVRHDSSNLMLGHILLFNSELAQFREEASRRAPIRYINSVRHRPATTLDSYPGETPLRLLLVHDLYADGGADGIRGADILLVPISSLAAGHRPRRGANCVGRSNTGQFLRIVSDSGGHGSRWLRPPGSFRR